MTVVVLPDAFVISKERLTGVKNPAADENERPPAAPEPVMNKQLSADDDCFADLPSRGPTHVVERIGGVPCMSVAQFIKRHRLCFLVRRLTVPGLLPGDSKSYDPYIPLLHCFHGRFTRWKLG